MKTSIAIAIAALTSTASAAFSEFVSSSGLKLMTGKQQPVLPGALNALGLFDQTRALAWHLSVTTLLPQLSVQVIFISSDSFEFLIPIVVPACRCLDGALKGTLQGGSVQIGVADSICQQFFATNSTPTAIEKGPVLGGTTTTTASSTQHTKAASSGFLASTSVGAAMLSALFLF
ncbi:hypothetical protein BDR26DRAFT_530324 [Obelidium mucronatum]|nr:hypothetical protein BDR26DRAFT_530324 [Obelidium mucronatum]